MIAVVTGGHRQVLRRATAIRPSVSTLRRRGRLCSPVPTPTVAGRYIGERRGAFRKRDNHAAATVKLHLHAEHDHFVARSPPRTTAAGAPVAAIVAPACRLAGCFLRLVVFAGFRAI
jgi:hypothetical protein